MSDTFSVGTSGDAVVAAGAAGTVIALMKRLTTDISTLIGSSGASQVQGIALDGAVIGTTKPVYVCGDDGTNLQALRTDTTGRQVVVGGAAAGAAIAGNPLLSGGSDGTNARAMLVDTTGRLGANTGNGNAAADGTALAQFVGPATSAGAVRVGWNMLNLIYNGSTADLMRTFNSASGSAGTGLLGAGIMGWDGDSTERVACDSTGALKFGGYTATVTATPTISTSAYTAGDSLGGKMSLSNAVRVSGGSGMIHRLTLTDLDIPSTAATIDVLFFNADPAATTFTDNAAFDLNDADIGKLIGTVRFVAATHRVDFADNGVFTIRDVNLPFVIASGTTLYAHMVIRTATTQAGTADLTLMVNILQD